MKERDNELKENVGFAYIAKRRDNEKAGRDGRFFVSSY